MNENRKISEAEYFLSQMQREEVLADYDKFAFNFSAFLTPARAAVIYALNEAEHRMGKEAARWTVESLTKQNQVLTFFKGIRNFNIHVQPVAPNKSVNIHLTESIKAFATITIDKDDAQGNLIEHFSPRQEEAPAQAQPPVIEHIYTLQEWSGPEDLLTLSRVI